MTGTETYTYGTSSSSFNVGRLITETDPSGSEGYAYDKIGRVTQVQKTIGATVYTTGFAYSSGDELTGITYPSGRAISYNFDNVGHLCQVAASASSSCGATAPYVAIPSSSYDASGRPLSATYGNGVAATAAYSPLSFKLTNLAYTKGTNTLLGLNYYYRYDSANCPGGNAIGNNGQIQCVADASSGTGDPGRSAAYTYDSLGRLFTAKTAGSTQYPTWGLSFTYDRYGNRTAQTVTAGSGYNSSLTVNPANNQITSPAFTYDAGGDVIAVPSPLSATYTYDGEECNTGYTGNGNTATYTCDGNHLHVKKVVTGTNAVTTVTIRSGGQVIAEYDNGAAVSSPTREYIYGSNLLATVTGSTEGSGGTIIYQHRDHLSPRLYTDVNGNDVGEQGTFPFGEVWYNNNTTSNWVFTSYERDAESGNDYALARSYSNNQGRFLAPDPLEGSVDDPQSWNRYAYVENDPINLDDPSGQSFWKELGFGIAEAFVTYFAPGIGNFLVTEFGVSQAVAAAIVNGIKGGLAVAGGVGVGQNFTLPTGQGICGICSPGGGGGPPVFSDNGTTQGTQGLTLPDDPSKLPPEWVPDKSHKAPNGERRVRGDGTKIDFDRAQEGEPGWAGKDHWHVIRPGEKKPDRTLGDRGHIAPGTTVDLPVFAPKFSPVLPIPNGLVPTCPYCDGAYSPIRPPGVYPGMVPGGVTPDVPVPSIPPFMPGIPEPIFVP
jgi:RHS repeat-associated protein